MGRQCSAGQGDAGLKKGYATAQTDAGHPIPTTAADVWRPDKWGTPETFADFRSRAIHGMTTVAKAVVAKYYGKPQTKAYLHGCSTGGRQGLMEVQRYPDDYDGVVSMAPVLSLTVQTSSAMRANTLGKPGAALTPELLSTVHAAVLASCDAKDGLADGLLDDPRQCSWDPVELLCKADQSGNACLTQPQIDALRTLYTGVKTSDGRVVAWPLARGDESSWRGPVPLSGPASDTSNAGGLGALTGPVFGDPNFNLATFDPARHYGHRREERIRERLRGERSEHRDVHQTRWQAVAVAWLGRRRAQPLAHDRLLRESLENHAQCGLQRAAIHGAERRTLRWRTWSRSIRCADRDR